MDYAGRSHRLQAGLREGKLDFLLVTHLPNVSYLSGFTGSAAALLISGRGATLFTDGRYIALAKEQVRDAHIVIASKSPQLAAAEWLIAQPKRVAARLLFMGFEPEALTAGMRDRLAAVLRGKVGLRSMAPVSVVESGSRRA